MIISTDASVFHVSGEATFSVELRRTDGFYSRATKPERQEFGDKFSRLNAAITPNVFSKAESLCRELDAAAKLYDLSGSKTDVVFGENGEIEFRLSSRYFRLFFSVEDKDEDSGWGLASHEGYRNLLAGGSLSSANCSDIIGMILPRRTSFPMLFFEGSESLATLTILAG